VEIEKNWESPNWLQNIKQRASWYGHALARTQTLPKPSHRGRPYQYSGTAYINMQKVGCALIQEVRGARQSLPAGFIRVDPTPPSHLTQIMLAELLRDQSRPESRADSDAVKSDLRTILKGKGERILKCSLSHSKFFKSHRGEFFNKMADRWADKGRDTEEEARWTSLRQRTIFTWAVPGKVHCSTMNKVVKTRAHLMAARLQVPDNNNLTAKFLKIVNRGPQTSLTRPEWQATCDKSWGCWVPWSHAVTSLTAREKAPLSFHSRWRWRKPSSLGKTEPHCPRAPQSGDQ